MMLLPRLATTPTTLKLVRRWVVRPELRADFDWLSRQPSMSGQKIGTLMDYLELSELQRNFIFPRMEDEMFRNYILSPQIGSGDSEGLHWRRELWESFYPGVRTASDPNVAAQAAVRLLRERVTTIPSGLESESVEAMWDSGAADREGFAKLLVAVLRSVGIPGRLSSAKQAEFWDGNVWTAAPQPLIAGWKELEAE